MSPRRPQGANSDPEIIEVIDKVRGVIPLELLDTELSEQAVALYVRLRLITAAYGETGWLATAEDLATVMGKSERTVRRAATELEQFGLLRRQETKTGVSRPSRWVTLEPNTGRSFLAERSYLTDRVAHTATDRSDLTGRSDLTSRATGAYKSNIPTGFLGLDLGLDFSSEVLELDLDLEVSSDLGLALDHNPSGGLTRTEVSSREQPSSNTYAAKVSAKQAPVEKLIPGKLGSRKLRGTKAVGSSMRPPKDTAGPPPQDTPQRSPAWNVEGATGIVAAAPPPVPGPQQPKPPRRDLYFEAFCEVTGNNWRELSAARNKAIGSMVAGLRKRGATTPDEIRRRATECSHRWPGIPLTPEMLTKHWASLGQTWQPGGKTKAADRLLEQAMGGGAPRGRSAGVGLPGLPGNDV